MKKLVCVTSAFVFAVLLLIGACETVVSAQGLPVCQLGGPTAVNPNRQLAEGESFVFTNRPIVVNLRFRTTKEHPERVGECVLPGGSKVAQKNGILVWVAKCGNDEVNQNIPVGPPSPTPIANAIRGLDGVNGKNGRDGLDGTNGIDGVNGKNGRNGKDGFCSSKRCRWTVGLVGTAVVVGGIVIAGDYYCWWQR